LSQRDGGRLTSLGLDFHPIPFLPSEKAVRVVNYSSSVPLERGEADWTFIHSCFTLRKGCEGCKLLKECSIGTRDVGGQHLHAKTTLHRIYPQFYNLAPVAPARQTSPQNNPRNSCESNEYKSLDFL